MVLRFHFLAVASVTVTVSVSFAGDGVRIDRSPGKRPDAGPTPPRSGVVTVLFGSKYCSRLPV